MMLDLNNALLSKEFWADYSSRLKDVAYRGAASAAGAPVDLMQTVMAPFGYLNKEPFLGSEWIGKKLEQSGLISNVRNAPAEILASLLVPGGLVKNIAFVAQKPTAQSFRKLTINDPIKQQQRPFQNDYPSATAQPTGGRLQNDIEGRPLSAEFIAGRRTQGGEDIGVGAADTAIAAGRLGATAREVPSKQIGGDAGRFVRSTGEGGAQIREILLSQGLDGKVAGGVYQHEFGHLIDDLVFGKGIDTAGIKKELQQIYHELNAPFRAGKGKWSPELDGYKGQDVDRELVAEAIRAYLQDPNYIKTVAPKAAKAIRAAVNANPNINKTIQFNAPITTAAGGGATAAAILFNEGDPD